MVSRKIDGDLDGGGPELVGDTLHRVHTCACMCVRGHSVAVSSDSVGNAAGTGTVDSYCTSDSECVRGLACLAGMAGNYGGTCQIPACAEDGTVELRPPGADQSSNQAGASGKLSCQECISGRLGTACLPRCAACGSNCTNCINSLFGTLCVSKCNSCGSTSGRRQLREANFNDLLFKVEGEGYSEVSFKLPSRRCGY